VQVRWEGGGTEPREEYTSFYGKGAENHESCAGHFIHWFSDDRQIEIRIGELLVIDPSTFEVETAIEKLKFYEPRGSDQIPVEMIQAGGEILRSKIHKLSNAIWNQEELHAQWKVT
jgi:hypothetical protein